MSISEARGRLLPYAAANARNAAGISAAAMPRASASIVPSQSVASRALVAVIAIMSLLSALTLGAVVLVRGAATDWQSQVAREMTVQVRPTADRDLEADVQRAASLVRATRGIAGVNPFTREESAKLLEPWLGTGLALDELPVPRLIVVTIAAGAGPDLDVLRRRLASEVPGATLDDHRGWVERMRTMTRTAVAIGLMILSLMLAATVLLVAFATRGAMAANHAIVEVLHFVGAKNHYIAGQFQRHFLLLGLKGAAIGGALAVLLFLAARLFGDRLEGVAGEQPALGLLGGLRLGFDGYAGIAGVVVLIAAVTAIASRWTVHRTLRALD